MKTEELVRSGRQMLSLFSVLIGGLALLFLVFLGTAALTTDLSDRIQVASLFVNSILSLTLVWVYTKIANEEQNQATEAAHQTDLVEKQTDLQEAIQSLQEVQVEIMGAQFEPEIEILDYGTGVDRPSNSAVSLAHGPPSSGDSFRIRLSNLRDAIATNLRLRLVVDYNGPSNYAESADIPLSRADNDQSLTSKPGGVLRGDETRIEYNCIPGLHLPLLDPESILPLSLCLSNLLDNGASHIRLGLIFVYEDRKGKEHKIDLEAHELNPANIPHGSPSLGNIRYTVDEVPIDLVRAELLGEGITQTPPKYQR